MLLVLCACLKLGVVPWNLFRIVASSTLGKNNEECWLCMRLWAAWPDLSGNTVAGLEPHEKGTSSFTCSNLQTFSAAKFQAASESLLNCRCFCDTSCLEE